MTDRYAVIGNPVEHSQSPLIHTLFASQTGQDLRYECVLAPLDGFAATVEKLRADGFKGANVTVPFKFEAFQLATRRTPRAVAAGAVNTLAFDASGVLGDNTDGAGLVRDIEHNLATPIADREVLLLGAGGAAEGVLLPLLERAPVRLTIANRTRDKALRMAQRAAHAGYPAVQAIALDALPGQSFDLVINATSTGLSAAGLPLPDGLFAPQALAYDMMYGRETSFMAQARAAGARVVDGLGMLVEQAAESFYLWRGVRPQTAPVIARLRA